MAKHVALGTTNYWFPESGYPSPQKLKPLPRYAFAMAARDYHVATGARVGYATAGRTRAYQQYLFDGWNERKPGFNFAASPDGTTHTKFDTLDWGMDPKFKAWLLEPVHGSTRGEYYYGLVWDGRVFAVVEDWHWRFHGGKIRRVLGARGKIELGDYGPHVDKVKQHLADLGHEELGDLHDGVWNKRCQDAVRDWKRKHPQFKLDRNGGFGVKAFNRMFPDFQK